MTIEVNHDYIRLLQQAIKQFKMRHGPFKKLHSKYRVYIYPSKYDSLFLLTLSDAGLTVNE
jgi:hypothetical protein